METLSNQDLISPELQPQKLRTLVRDPFNPYLVLVGNSEHADLSWDGDSSSEVLTISETIEKEPSYKDIAKNQQIELIATVTAFEQTEDMRDFIESDPEHHAYAGTDPDRNPFYALDKIDERIISRDLSRFYSKNNHSSSPTKQGEIEYNNSLHLISKSIDENGTTRAHYELKNTLIKLPDGGTNDTSHLENPQIYPAKNLAHPSTQSFQTIVEPVRFPTQVEDVSPKIAQPSKNSTAKSGNRESELDNYSAPKRQARDYDHPATKLPSPMDLAREIQAGIHGANRIATSAGRGMFYGAQMYPRAILPSLVKIAQTSFKPVPVVVSGLRGGMEGLVHLGDQYKDILPVVGKGISKVAGAGYGAGRSLGEGVKAVGLGLDYGAKISSQFWLPVLKFGFTPILNLSGLMILLGSFPFVALFKGFDAVWKIGETINDNVSKKWALDDLKKSLLYEFDKFKQPIQLWRTRFDQENQNISKKIAQLKNILPQEALAWRELDDLETNRRKIFEQAQQLISQLSDLIKEFEAGLKQAATPDQVRDIISRYLPKLDSPKIQEGFSDLETAWQRNQKSYKNLGNYLNMIAEKYKPAAKLAENTKVKNLKIGNKISYLESGINNDLNDISKIFYRKDAAVAVDGLCKQIQSKAKVLSKVFDGIVNTLPKQEHPALLEKLQEFVNLLNFLKNDPLILTIAELHTTIGVLNSQKLSEAFSFLLQLSNAEVDYKLLDFQNRLPSLYSLEGKRLSDTDGLGPLQTLFSDADSNLKTANQSTYSINNSEKASLNIANSRIKKENQDIARANEIIANSNIEKLGLNQTQYALLNWDNSAMKNVVDDMLERALSLTQNPASMETEDYSLIINLYKKIANAGNVGKFITGKLSINLFAASYKDYLNSVNFKNDAVINIVDLSQDILTKFQAFNEYKNQTKNLGRDLQHLYYALHGKTHPSLEPINGLRIFALRSISSNQVSATSQDTVAIPSPVPEQTSRTEKKSNTTPDPIAGANHTPPPPNLPPSGPNRNEGEDDDSEKMNLGRYVLMYNKLILWFRNVVNKFSPNYKQLEEILKNIENEIKKDKSDLRKIREWLQEGHELQQKINEGDEPKTLPLIPTQNFHWTSLLNGLDKLSSSVLKEDVLGAIEKLTQVQSIASLLNDLKADQSRNLIEYLSGLDDSNLNKTLYNIKETLAQLKPTLNENELALFNDFEKCSQDFSNQLETKLSKREVCERLQQIYDIRNNKSFQRLSRIIEGLLVSFGLDSIMDLPMLPITSLADTLDFVQSSITTQALQNDPLCKLFDASVKAYQTNLTTQLISNRRAYVNLESFFKTNTFQSQISRFLKEEMNISQQMKLLSGRSLEYIEQNLQNLFSEALNPQSNIINLTPAGIISDYGLFYKLHRQNARPHGKFMTAVLMPTEEVYLKKFIFEKFIPEFVSSLKSLEKQQDFIKNFSQIFDPKTIDTYQQLSANTFSNRVINQADPEISKSYEKIFFRYITANVPKVIAKDHPTTLKELKKLLDFEEVATNQIQYFESTPGMDNKMVLNGLETRVEDCRNLYQKLFEELFAIVKNTVLTQYRTYLPHIKYDRLESVNKALLEGYDDLENKAIAEAAFWVAKQNVAQKIEKVLDQNVATPENITFDNRIRHSLTEMINRINLET